MPVQNRDFFYGKNRWSLNFCAKCILCRLLTYDWCTDNSRGISLGSDRCLGWIFAIFHIRPLATCMCERGKTTLGERIFRSIAHFGACLSKVLWTQMLFNRWKGPTLTTFPYHRYWPDHQPFPLTRQTLPLGYNSRTRYRSPMLYTRNLAAFDSGLMQSFIKFLWNSQKNSTSILMRMDGLDIRNIHHVIRSCLYFLNFCYRHEATSKESLSCSSVVGLVETRAWAPSSRYGGRRAEAQSFSRSRRSYDLRWISQARSFEPSWWWTREAN